MDSSAVEGLRIVPRFIDARAEAEMIRSIDAGEWSTELRRRVQHHGHRYDYKARRLASVGPPVPLPAWCRSLVRAVHDAGLTTLDFDQVIVNEYLPGQGIAAHVDCVPCFAEEIVSVSLGSACIMTFSQPALGLHHDVLLENGDLMLMRGDARFRWRHEIKARKTDRWNGAVLTRQRRISVTLRKIIEQE